METGAITVAPIERRSTPADTRYSRGAIVLHWSTALLVVAMVALGFRGAAGSEDDALAQSATDVHKTLGIVVLTLTVVRIGWRLAHRPPPLPATPARRPGPRLPRADRPLPPAVLRAADRDAAQRLVDEFRRSRSFRHTFGFGFVDIPFLPVPQGWASAGPARFVHVNLAFVMIALVGLHIAGVLKHHFVDQDDILARMLPRASRPPIPGTDDTRSPSREEPMTRTHPPTGRGPLPQTFPHEPERLRKAADLIVAMRLKQIEIDGETGLPEDARPRNRDEAQQVSDLVMELLDRPVLGWKYYIGAMIQQAPLLTPIYDIWESPAVLPAEVSQHRWIEPELAFRALRDFPPRERAYGYQEIVDGMEAVPVFEIIGPRFRFDSAAHMRQVVNGYRITPRFDGLADNNASGGYVVGAARADWQELDLLTVHVTMDAGRERLVDTVGGHPLVDPFISTFPLVNGLRRGRGLKAGMLLATHSYSGFLPVPADEKVVSTFTGFAPVEAVFRSA